MKSLLALVLALALPATPAMAQFNNSSQDVTIWFYRPADSSSSQDIPTVHEVGGLTRRLARLAPGEFFGYTVQPGTHTFSYTRAPARGQALNLLVKAGQPMYVEVQFRNSTLYL
jgi:hypothetical protein